MGGGSEELSAGSLRNQRGRLRECMGDHCQTSDVEEAKGGRGAQRTRAAKVTSDNPISHALRGTGGLHGAKACTGEACYTAQM